VPYSEGAPVFEVWKRWLSVGRAWVVIRLLPPDRTAFSIASRFGWQGTWRSFSPLMARIGQVTFARVGRGS
jgi:hypothetical protein